MTRINVIPPSELTDQHLMAEYRELPMVMGSLKRTLSSKAGFVLDKVSKKYTLNSGHVYFWYNKKQWLWDRYNKLIDELKIRKYNINPGERNVDWSVFDSVPQIEWNPDDDAYRINNGRIQLRISQKPDWYRTKVV